MNVTEYTVITSVWLNAVVDKVNELISKGWQPVGGITHEESPGAACGRPPWYDTKMFYQAMARYDVVEPGHQKNVLDKEVKEEDLFAQVADYIDRLETDIRADLGAEIESQVDEATDRLRDELEPRLENFDEVLTELEDDVSTADLKVRDAEEHAEDLVADLDAEMSRRIQDLESQLVKLTVRR